MAFTKSTDFKAFVCFEIGLIRLLCGLLVICHRKIHRQSWRNNPPCIRNWPIVFFLHIYIYIYCCCCCCYCCSSYLICQFSCRGRGKVRGCVNESDRVIAKQNKNKRERNIRKKKRSTHSCKVKFTHESETA